MKYKITASLFILMLIPLSSAVTWNGIESCNNGLLSTFSISYEKKRKN